MTNSSDHNDNSNNRRGFLHQSVLGTAVAGMTIASNSHVTAQTLADAGEPEITQTVDVLVVGGGTAGQPVVWRFQGCLMLGASR